MFLKDLQSDVSIWYNVFTAKKYKSIKGIINETKISNYIFGFMKEVVFYESLYIYIYIYIQEI